MILSGFCQDDFVERVMVDKAFIPVPLLPSKVAAGDKFGEVQIKRNSSKERWTDGWMISSMIGSAVPIIIMIDFLIFFCALITLIETDLSKRF
jgi:hypothetical protein